jgi:hypothetical protein
MFLNSEFRIRDGARLDYPDRIGAYIGSDPSVLNRILGGPRPPAQVDSLDRLAIPTIAVSGHLARGAVRSSVLQRSVR